MDKPIVILLCVISGLVLIGGLTLLYFFVFKKHSTKTYNEKVQNIINQLGGNDNIISVNVKMSRIELTLKDYDLVNKDELKNLGVQGISKTSQKITLVVGNELANDINNAFSKN